MITVGTSTKRDDIQILRAIAVLTVVIFHLGEHWLPLGYLGVDMFFVISGFVITRGILRRSKTGIQFSAREFLWRRINRLLPALLFTLFLSLMLGFLLYSPKAFEGLAESAIYALGGVANIWFFTQTDYFSAPLDTMPLLHTWSLSVEEQFYLLFAVITAIIAWRKVELVRWTFFVWLPLCLGSLYLVFADLRWLGEINLIEELALDDPGSSFKFFMLPTRIYQLSFGILGACLIAHIGSIRMPDWLRICIWYVLALMACGLIIFSGIHTPVEIVTLALSLTTLTLLLIGETNKDLGSYRLLTPLVAIGDRSYSIYLVHWPIIVFVVFYLYTKGLWVTLPLSLVLTVVLSECSWRFFERTSRSKKALDGKKAQHKPVVMIYSIALLCVLAFTVYSNGGMTWRMPDLSAEAAASELYFKRPTGYVSHRRPNNRNLSKWAEFMTFEPESPHPKAERVLVLGDSHARHLFPLAHYFVTEKQQIWDFYSFTGGPPIFGYYKVYGTGERKHEPPKQVALRDQVKAWEQYLRNNPGKYDYVVLSCRWNGLVNHDDFCGLTIRHDALVPLDAPPESATLENSKKNFIKGLHYTIDIINESGAKAIVFGQPPLNSRSLEGADNVPRFLFTEELIDERVSFDPYEDIIARGALVDGILRDPASHGLPNFHSVVAMDVFCDHDRKICNKRIHGIRMLDDTNHLTYEGALFLAKEWEMQPNHLFKNANEAGSDSLP